MSSESFYTHLGGIMGFKKPLIARTKVGVPFGGQNSTISMDEDHHHHRHHHQHQQLETKRNLKQTRNHNQIKLCQRPLNVGVANNNGSSKTKDDDDTHLNGSCDFENRLRRNNHNAKIKQISSPINTRLNLSFKPHQQHNNTSSSSTTTTQDNIITEMRLHKRIQRSPIRNGELRCLCLMMLTLIAIASSSSGSWFAYSQLLELTPDQVPALINLANFPASLDTQQLSLLSSSMNSDQLKNYLANSNNNNYDSNSNNNITAALLAAVGAANSIQSMVASKNVAPDTFNQAGHYQQVPDLKHQQTAINTNQNQNQPQLQEQQQQQPQPVASTTQTPLVESQLVAPSMGSPQVETMVTAASKKKKKMKMMKKKKKMEKKHKEWKKGKKHKKKKYESKKKKGGMSKKKKGKLV